MIYYKTHEGRICALIGPSHNNTNLHIVQYTDNNELTSCDLTQLTKITLTEPLKSMKILGGFKKWSIGWNEDCSIEIKTNHYPNFTSMRLYGASYKDLRKLSEMFKKASIPPQK